MKIKCLIKDVFYDGCLKEIDFTLRNLTDKTIKYYTFTFLFYNRVGDLETPEEGFSYEFMGPVLPHQEISHICDDIDHDTDHFAFRSKLIKLKIQYMDNSVETFSRKQIDLQEEREDRDLEMKNTEFALALILGAIVLLGLVFMVFFL